MRAIDLFCGFGGMTDGARAAGVNVVWAANHWPLAVNVHHWNHPETEHACQDLRQANWAKVPQYDLLLASPACVPLDAEVERADGTRTCAGDLKVGDVVLTHEGRARPIVNIWAKSYTGTMCGFRMWGDTKVPVEMTADHLVWVRRRGGKYNKFAAPQFMRADEVRPGDYVAFPRVTPTLGTAEAFVRKHLPTDRVEYACQERTVRAFSKKHTKVRKHIRRASKSSLPGFKVEIPCTADLWWLLGHYLGDGQARADRYQLGWSVGNSSENLVRVQTILTHMGLASWVHGTASNLTVFAQSKHLHAMCMAFGRLCHEKSIPAELLRLESEYARQLVDGYLAADGHNVADRVNPTERATTTSLHMIQGLQRMCWNLGWSAGISRADYAREATIQGRRVTCLDSWELTVIKSPHRQSRTKFDLDPKLVWRSVRSVTLTEVRDLPVLDFEVEEDHTFCLPGMVVHNCQGHSEASQPKRARDQKFHDADRQTAWAVIDALEVGQPRGFVIENVVQFSEWKLYGLWWKAMEALGYKVTATIVRASDCGVPQRRDRLFIVGTRKRHVEIRVPRTGPEPAFEPCVDWESGDWRPIRSCRFPNARERLLGAHKRLGRCLVQHTSDHRGIPATEPIRTITTKVQWCAVDDGRYRYLTPREHARAMGFREDYWWDPELPAADVVKGFGNAVCPPVGEVVIRQVADAAA